MKKSKDLEAQISELARINSVLRMDYEEILEENEETDNLLTLSNRRLLVVQADYASLNSRYQQLLKVVVTLTTQAEKNDQEE